MTPPALAAASEPSTPAGPAPAATSRRAAFERWMAAQGIWLDPRAAIVDPAESSDAAAPAAGAATAAAVGVLATAELCAGETICRIPKAAVLSWRNVFDEAHYAELERVPYPAVTAIALAVERARGAASRWHGYVQFLPDEEPLPLLWSEADLALLAGTGTATLVAQQRSSFTADYHRHVRPLFRRHAKRWGLPEAATTLQSFLQAASLVSSRAFDVDAHHGHAMVPLADLFNHRSGAETIHVIGSGSACSCCVEDSDGEEEDDDDDDESAEEGAEDDDDDDDEAASNGSSDAEAAGSSGEVGAPADAGDAPAAARGHRRQRLASDADGAEIGTQSDGGLSAVTDPFVLEMELVANVAANEEIWNTYGELGNAALLCKYGFAELGNPHDTVTLPASMVHTAARRAVGETQWKARWRYWRQHADAEAEFVIAHDGTIPDGLLALLMTATAPPDAFASWMGLDAVEAASADAILAMPRVRDALEAALAARWAQYAVPDTSEAELERLPALPAGPARYAAIVRIGEKQVIERARALLAAAAAGPSALDSPRKRVRTA